MLLSTLQQPLGLLVHNTAVGLDFEVVAAGILDTMGLLAPGCWRGLFDWAKINKSLQWVVGEISGSWTRINAIENVEKTGESKGPSSSVL